MGQKFWLSVLVWFLSLSALMGQADSSFVHLRVQLVNSQTQEAVPFATVLFLPKYGGITSDENGFFETNIHLNKVDSLLISSIGFENKKMNARELKFDSVTNTIFLDSKIYMLSEVKITQYPTYEELVKAITNPIYSEDEKKILRAYDRMDEVGLNRIAKESGQKGFGGPISALYSLFSHEDKSRRKYERLLKEDELEDRIIKLVSADVIRHITGFEDSISISKFIKYCNFSDYVLKNLSEYELLILVQQKYNEYLRAN